MESKKNPKVDIGRNSSIFFALGLALMVFISYGAINYKIYDKSALGIDKLNLDELDEEEVPITEQIVPPPPPPPPPAPDPASASPRPCLPPSHVPSSSPSSDGISTALSALSPPRRPTSI